MRRDSSCLLDTVRTRHVNHLHDLDAGQRAPEPGMRTGLDFVNDFAPIEILWAFVDWNFPLNGPLN